MGIGIWQIFVVMALGLIVVVMARLIWGWRRDDSAPPADRTVAEEARAAAADARQAAAEARQAATEVRLARTEAGSAADSDRP